jgi:WhiB family redox-sensing transcriptional regulator
MAFSVADLAPGLVDLRCPSDLPGRDGRCHPGRLLAKVYLSGERPSFVHPDNLIELKCAECRDRHRKAGRRVMAVFHRFDFAGELAGTLVVDEDQRGLPRAARGIRNMARDWRDDAACAGMDTEWWFPVSAYPHGTELLQLRAAQETCGSCPVRLDCLQWAVEHHERGVWGGMTEAQRRGSRLCRGLRAAALA